MIPLSDQVLILGATTRLTRLVTTDDLGQWLIRDPIDSAMKRWEDRHCVHEHNGVPCRPWWWKYRSGLICPHCVGQHVAFGVLTSYALTGRSPRARSAWRFVAAGLTLNAVSTVLGREFDYWDN